MKELEIRFDNQPLDGDKIGFTIKNAGIPITFDNGETGVDLTFNQNTTIAREGFVVMNDATSVSDINIETLIDSGYVIDAVTDGNYIWLAGTFSLVGGTISKLVKIDLSGTIMQHWGNTINNTVRKLYLQDDGKLLVGGDFTSFNTISTNRLTRLNTDGSVDLTFNANVVIANRFDNLIHDIKVRTAGKILVGGSFNRGICELNANGTPTSILFNNSGYGADNTVRTISLIEGSDSFFIGGDFTTFNGTVVGYIAMIASGGTYTTRFGSGFNASVYKILSAPNNPTNLIIAAPATYYNGVACKGGIFKVNSSTNALSLNIDTNFRNAIGDGVIDSELIFNIEPISRVSFVELNNIETAAYNNYNDLLMITGSFEYFNRKPSKRVYIIDEDGNDAYLTAKPAPLNDEAFRTRTPVFNVGVVDDFVYKALQLNSKFYLFGSFSSLRGYVTNNPLNNLSLGEFKKYTNTFEWNFANIPTGTDVQVDFAIENAYGVQNVSFYFNPTSGGVNKVYTPDIPTMITNFRDAIISNFYLYDFGYKFDFTIAGNSLKLEILSDFSNHTFTYTEYESMSFAAGTFNQAYIGELEQTIINTFLKLNYNGFFTSDLDNWCTWKDNATEIDTLVYKYTYDVDGVIDIPTRVVIILSPAALVTNSLGYLTRSPYLTKTISGITHSQFTITSYNGIINIDAPVTYQVTKQKVLSTQTTFFVDVSGLTNEKFECDITNFMNTYDTVPHLLSTTESKWVKVNITDYNETEIVNSTDTYYYVMDGFVYNTEINGLNAFKKVLTPLQNMIARGSRAKMYFKNRDLWTITYELVNDEISNESGPITLNAFDYDSNNYYNSLDVSALLGVYGRSITFTLTYEGEEVETVTYTVYDECKYDIYDIVFKNKWGVLETISMSKKSSIALNTEGTEFLRNIGDVNGDFDIARHSQSVFNVNATEEITLNTDYIPEYMNESIKQCMLSEEVWMIRGNVATPVIKVDQSVSFKTSLNDKLIQYTLKVKTSHKTINSVK